MSNKNVVNISRFREHLSDEKIERAADGAITPGHLVMKYGGKLKVHNVAGGDTARIFADADKYQGNGVDTAYIDGQKVFADLYYPGDRVQALLAAGENAAADDKLASAGDGTLRVALAAVAATLGTGVEASNNAITFTANKAGTAGNDIKVALIDPAGNSQSLSVTVEGTYIKVSLATDGAGAITSTPATIIAAIAASPAAATLVTADDTGESTGAVAVAAVAATALSGGTAADVAVCEAGEAVNNSAGETAAKIEAIVI
jgi:hypothetical protein